MFDESAEARELLTAVAAELPKQFDENDARHDGWKALGAAHIAESPLCAVLPVEVPMDTTRTATPAELQVSIVAVLPGGQPTMLLVVRTERAEFEERFGLCLVSPNEKRKPSDTPATIANTVIRKAVNLLIRHAR